MTTLRAGTRLGPYEILGVIGAGGMGEVYRARDPRLGRDVAVKVLPASTTGDSDRRNRFMREARASAAVNHPNIATVHEVGDADGLIFIAMELVEGETLRSRLRSGPLPIQETLQLAVEIAEGLAYAHRSRIIHRDLKPDNIIIREDGHPKILDFGLAKLLGPYGPAEASEAETVAEPMTREGKIMGTPAYMSPEQARGETVDARSDIFSLGTTIYEMTAGKAPFTGRTPTDTLGAILREKPATPSDLNDKVPRELDRIVGKCLEKAPEDRYQYVDDLAVDLRKLRKGASTEVDGAFTLTSGVATPRKDVAPAAGSRARSTPWLAAGLFGVTLVAGGGLGWWMSHRGERPASGNPMPVRSFEIDIGEALSIYDWSIVSEFALSPDGALLAYVARIGDRTQLYLRRLDDIRATPVPGTEHALGPFFSPDGKWIAYYAADAVGKVNELRKVPVEGGPSQVLCNAWPPSGGTWLPDGTIVFASTEPFTDHPVWDGSVRWGLFRVDDTGGVPRLLVSVDRSAGGEAAFSRPRDLPGGQQLLFTLRRTGGEWAKQGSNAEEPDWTTATAEVDLLDLASGAHRTLIQNAHDAAYSGTGHILFMRGDALWAAPFDPGTSAVTGPEKIIRHDLQSMMFPTMNSPYALDGRGSAVFLPAAAVESGRRVMVWVDRKGGLERADVPPANLIQTPRVSPDGERILYVVQGITRDIWVHERSRPGSHMRLTYDETDDEQPVWFPDSRRFLFVDRRSDKASPIGYVFGILQFRADGAGKPIPWPMASPDLHLSIPMVILEDGRKAIFQEGGSARTRWDIADSSLPPPGRYIVQSPALEEDPVLSPDGRWLAYSSLDTGPRQIYVRPYPDTQSARWQITSDGGQQPLWAPDGTELYYRNEAAMMAVPIRARPSFRAGAPVRLFEGNFINPDGPRRDYDLEYPEGRRFLMVEEFDPGAPDTRLVYVQNWAEELKRLVPPGAP